MRKVGSILGRVLSAAIAVALLGVFFLNMYQVIGRYLFGIGAVWIPDLTRLLFIWMVFLGTASLVTFLLPEITPIYPWLTRRYVEFTIPLLAILSGIGLGWIWDVGKSSPRLGRAES